jgi:hypothetical protein
MQSTRKTAKKTATVWGSLKTNRLQALKQKKHKERMKHIGKKQISCFYGKRSRCLILPDSKSFRPVGQNPNKEHCPSTN